MAPAAAAEPDVASVFPIHDAANGHAELHRPFVSEGYKQLPGGELPLRIANNASELIGNTPMVYLNRIADGCVARIAAKMEFFNPGGSVKDRIALSMINSAEEQGLISPGRTTLVEATSGNTGIGLATVAAQRGYKLILIMPDKCPMEKRMLLLQLGAKVIITDFAKGVQGVLDKLEEVGKKLPDSFSIRQFENPANPAAHVMTTGPEIWRDTAGKVDIFVSAAGTGGTITGVARFLKSKNPAIRSVVIEPAESAVLSGGQPGPHKIQGIGAGLVPETLDRSVIDEIITVTSDDAFYYAKRVAKTDGLLVGISSGAAIKAALDLGKREENEGKLIVVLLASGAERYLTTELYEESRLEAESLEVHEVFDPASLDSDAKRQKVEEGTTEAVADPSNLQPEKEEKDEIHDAAALVSGDKRSSEKEEKGEVASHASSLQPQKEDQSAPGKEEHPSLHNKHEGDA